MVSSVCYYSKHRSVVLWISGGYFSDLHVGKSWSDQEISIRKWPEACDWLYRALLCKGGRAVVKAGSLQQPCLPLNHSFTT